MEQNYLMGKLMRWFSPSDPVSLASILQSGCTGVVSALHEIPVGEIWPLDKILAYKRHIESKNLTWEVVESLPVHEDIKLRKGDYQYLIDNYKQSIRNLAAAGIKVITYNFMPVFDWVRTNVSYTLANGSEALFFDKSEYEIFDLFLLKRPHADKNYSKDRLLFLQKKCDSMSAEHKEQIYNNILLGFPGTSTQLTSTYVLDKIHSYKNISRKDLRANLISFLKEISPLAEAENVSLSLHPDDPPYPIFNLPRIVSSNADIDFILKAVPIKANGLCFCTGSLGVREDNNLIELIRKWGSRINFLHLRNTKREDQGNFYEAPHLDGDTDMRQIVQEILLLSSREKRSIPMRPDHGHKMLDDLEKSTYPGYSCIGRLKGLAELRGLEHGLASII